jgi:hypothetical protein
MTIPYSVFKLTRWFVIDVDRAFVSSFYSNRHYANKYGTYSHSASHICLFNMPIVRTLLDNKIFDIMLSPKRVGNTVVVSAIQAVIQM